MHASVQNGAKIAPPEAEADSLDTQPGASPEQRLARSLASNSSTHGVVLGTVESSGTSGTITAGEGHGMPVTDYDFKVQRVYGAKQQPYAIGSDIVLRVAGNASMPAEGYPSLANGSQVVVFVIDQPPTGLAGARTASVLPVASPNDIAIVAAERLTWAGKVWDLNTFSDDLQKHPSPN